MRLSRCEQTCGLLHRYNTHRDSYLHQVSKAKTQQFHAHVTLPAPHVVLVGILTTVLPSFWLGTAGGAILTCMAGIMIRHSRLYQRAKRLPFRTI